MRRGGPRVNGPYKHGDRWRCHIVGADGKRRYRSFETRAAAETYAASARDEAQGVTVTQSIDAFLDAKRAQGRAALTIEAYGTWLRILLAPVLPRPLRAVRSRGSELYAATVAGRRSDTHRNFLVVGHIWARWCVKRRWLKADPFADVEAIGSRRHGADKTRLGVDESRKLMTWCCANSNDVGAVLALGYLLLGARASELTARNVRDLDDNGTLLNIGRTKTSSGERRLRIPAPLDEMLSALSAGRGPEDPIFVNTLGRRMSRSTAKNHVRRACVDAGVTEISPQALRRTQATLATDAGETGLAVARHLGHSTGEAPAVTGRSYVGRDSQIAARGKRALRVLRGGMS